MGKKFSLNGRRLVISIPYLWFLLFFLVPFIIVLKISFAEMQLAQPPYTEMVTHADERLTITLNYSNYQLLFDDFYDYLFGSGEDSLYLPSYLMSVRMALVATLICLLIGFPMAWAIASATPKMRNVLLMLIILPSWTSFLIRVYAWMSILGNNGFLNNILLSVGVIDTPLQILNTPTAVYIGMVYAYLPFMILPIYAALLKIDDTLIEAAADLGSRPWKTLWSVIIPLTKGGIIAGSMLVFIPAVGEFVIPELLGGADSLLIGRVLWQEFFNNRDWPVASAVAVIMLAVLMVPIMWFHFQQRRTLRGQL